MSTGINMDKLQETLKAKRFGRSIFFARSVNSTNDWARELAESGASEGTVAIAGVQTAGRGRLGREWVSPRGGLWFSVVLTPALKPADAVRLVFVGGLALTEVLREKYGLEVETKWPNDVLANRRKVCGILSEMHTTDERVNYVIMGVGVNANFDADRVFSDELRKIATSLETELGNNVRLEELFRALLEKLESVYDAFLNEGFAAILTRWKRYAGFIGHQVEVTSQNGSHIGIALDVAEDGSLAIKLRDGSLKHFLVGDVSLRKK